MIIESTPMYNELTNLISELGRVLPQLGAFIDRFNEIVETGTTVSRVASSGIYYIDVPTSMSTPDAEVIRGKVTVLGNLINTHNCTVNELFRKAWSLEKSLVEGVSGPINPIGGLSSQLSDHVIKYMDIQEAYKLKSI